jgi:hypothetical protein
MPLDERDAVGHGIKIQAFVAILEQRPHQFFLKIPPCGGDGYYDIIHDV